MPARKNSPANPIPDPSSEGLLVVVGQLLEATKAATEGIKSLSAEVRSNATAIIMAVKTLEVVEETVCQLNDIVRNSPTSMVRTIDEHARLIVDLNKAHSALTNATSTLTTRVDGIGQQNTQQQTRLGTVNHMVWYALAVVAWLITTGIALYAALKGK